ncbi:MAG: iron-sulfur cluster assembly scaffold protein [Thermacetogeniaceae bacterium]
MESKGEIEIAKEELRKAGYSEGVIENWLNPKNLKEMDKNECNGDSGWYTGPCGDSIRIFLRVTDGVIRDASFLSDICIGTVACGNMLTEMIKGLKVEEALKIQPEDVINKLGGVPKESEHCAKLAVITLKKAIADYEKYRQAPWKRAYEQNKSV